MSGNESLYRPIVPTRSINLAGFILASSSDMHLPMFDHAKGAAEYETDAFVALVYRRCSQGRQPPLRNGGFSWTA